MRQFRCKNLEKYQHYRDRNPPWIKLHQTVLADYDVARLPDASKAHLFAIWLLASCSNNVLPWDPAWIAGRIGATEPVDLDLLAKAGRIIEITGENAASETLAPRKQNAPQRERKRESKNKSKKHTRACRLPDDWELTDELRAYAQSKGCDPDLEAEKFRDHWWASSGAGAEKFDWNAGFRTWIRNAVKFARQEVESGRNRGSGRNPGKTVRQGFAAIVAENSLGWGNEVAPVPSGQGPGGGSLGGSVLPDGGGGDSGELDSDGGPGNAGEVVGPSGAALRVISGNR